MVAKRFNIGEEMTDAFDYCPQIDDVARTLDEASLWYAAQKCVQALEDARVALKQLPIENRSDFAFDWESPWGWIRIRGRRVTTLWTAGTRCSSLILGGNDVYSGEVGASTAERPVGLLLDMGGDDHYTSEVPGQGAGLCGVGMVVDNQGNDRYDARHYAQGGRAVRLGSVGRPGRRR